MNSFDAVHSAVGHVSNEAGTMPTHCPAMIQAGGASQSLCEAQCVPKAQADKAGDVRIALAPPSVLVVRVSDLIAPSVVHAPPPRASIASPPLSLLFSRFRN